MAASSSTACKGNSRQQRVVGVGSIVNFKSLEVHFGAAHHQQFVNLLCLALGKPRLALGRNG